MPEHDDFDLVGAFAAFERDITSIWTAPGAAQAMTATRRRRRAAIGVVASVAVVAVVAALAGHGLLARTGNSVGPVDGLPVPRPIDAASLTDATTGWTPAWESTGASKNELVDSGISTDCLARVVGAVIPEPPLAGSDALLAGQAVAFINVADFGHDDASADNAWHVYSSGAASCTGVRETANDTSGPAQITRYVIAPGEPQAAQYIWLVRVNDQIGVAWIGNAVDPMPDGVGDRVTNALLAGVLSPASYTESPGDNTDGTAASKTPTTSS